MGSIIFHIGGFAVMGVWAAFGAYKKMNKRFGTMYPAKREEVEHLLRLIPDYS